MPESSSRHSARNDGGEIATSTLAEIYAQQGLLGRALSIYRRMLARAPEDSAIADRIRSLEVRMAETGPEPQAETGLASGPPAERERLPWDPPEVEAAVAEAGSEAGGATPLDAASDLAPEAAPVDSVPAPEAAAVDPLPAPEPAPAEPVTALEPVPAEPPRRAGRMDAETFRSWLNGR